MLVTSHFNRSNPHQLARHVAATDGHRQTLPQSFTAAMLPRGVLGLIALILATPVTTRQKPY